jgi:hypothetical protein
VTRQDHIWPTYGAWHGFDAKHVKEVLCHTHDESLDVLVVTFLVEKDMVILAVMLEYAKKGARAS